MAQDFGQTPHSRSEKSRRIRAKYRRQRHPYLSQSAHRQQHLDVQKYPCSRAPPTSLAGHPSVMGRLKARLGARLVRQRAVAASLPRQTQCGRLLWSVIGAFGLQDPLGAAGGGRGRRAPRRGRQGNPSWSGVSTRAPVLRAPHYTRPAFPSYPPTPLLTLPLGRPLPLSLGRLTPERRFQDDGMGGVGCGPPRVLST